MLEIHIGEVYIYPDKAKPSVRKGRKAAGLLKEMAELPEDNPKAVRLLFLFCF